ncbi:RHS repeat-associated core domain-containing protein [Microbacterium sp. KSW2-21]|uniref:RHS repeat-associated core domain-containing protein n=1 Tax=Microbacterium algihabitans TaxID=3075992 RepID=A0ABU3S150_9MICO|nr:RHS repeat-associated core domain-containing protein [Microbacterium sp. KSW2-21]MDU0328520.1 RHS repeat-associated core domain-containing protein [Microbacterium sp. KSW2-21]
MRPSKALLGVLATAIVVIPLVTVTPAYADKPDNLSSETTPSTDQAAPEIPGTSLEDREATPEEAAPEELPPGDPVPTPETVWAPTEEADDTAVPEDSNAPDQAWAPLPNTRLTPGGRQGAANRAPAGTVAGAPGLGELPWFAFQDFELSTDTTAQVNLANGNLLLKANDLVVRVPGYGLRHDRFYNGLSTVAGSLGGGWQTNNAENDLGITATSTYADFFGPNGLKLRFTKSGSSYTSPAGSNMTLKENTSSTTSRFVLTQNQSGDELRFNTSGFLTRTFDRNGVGETYTYASGKVTQVAHANGRAIFLDRASSTSTTISKVRDSAGREVGYTYDSNNRLKTVTSTDGKVTTYTYDSTGRISTMVIPVAGAAGATTTVTFTYDSSHRVTKVSQQPGIDTTFAYTSGQTVVTDAKGNASTYAIDPSGKVSSATDALGRIRSQKWTANNDISTATDALGTGVTTYTYDGSNNRTAAQLPTGAAASAQYAIGTNCSAPNTGTAFQPKCSTDDAGNKKQYEYDSAGNPTKQTDTSGSTPVVEFEKTYGTCGGYGGQVCTTKDGNGNVTSYTYNAKGDLAKVTPPAPMGETSYTYDALGRLTYVTDGTGYTTAYQYDVRDRIVLTTYDNGANVSTVYYDNGLEKSRTDSAGGVKTSEYDQQGRLTRETGPRSGVEMNYKYDKVGNLTSYSGANPPGPYVNIYAEDSYRLFYDAANQLTLVQQGGGNICPEPMRDNSGCIRFEYDDNGAETKRILPGNATIETVRDVGGRPSRITAKTWAGTTVVDIGYSYAAPSTGDDRGNVQTRTSYAEQGITAGAVTTYTYDSRNRLKKVEEKNGSAASASWAYTFDANGNRTKITRTGSTGITGNKTFTYNAANQLTAATGDSSTWTYDAAGNQTRDGSGFTSSYGVRSQVRFLGTAQQTNFATGNTERYGVSTGLSFDNGALGLMRRTDGSTTEHTYTRTAEGAALGYKDIDDSRFYYVTDHLGSVVGVFDGEGVYRGGYSYSPDGEARFTGGNTAVTNNQLRYIGELSVGGGFYKFGARYYDASQARFTQMDPSGQEDNPYAYAACNPINGIDPSGLATLSQALCVGGVISLLTEAYGIAKTITATTAAILAAPAGGPVGFWYGLAGGFLTAAQIGLLALTAYGTYLGCREAFFGE